MNDRKPRPFDFRPRLEGPRILLRPLVEADWNALFAAAADPRIWEQHPEPLRWTEPVFRRFFNGALASGAAIVFVEQASGRVIGSSRYHGHDPERSEVEIGWTFLVRDRWGGEWNREVKQLMLDHAFRYVDRVVFWVGQDNLRSRRAMEKLGARLRPGVHERPPGSGSPNVIYEIDRVDWRRR